MGYHRAGFDMTGVDLHPQPRYPFRFIQADALTYLAEHGHEYDAIFASPPCQAHTSLKTMHNARPHLDLIPETRALLRAFGTPWVIENVPGAPMPGRSITLCGSSFGLGVAVYDGWRQLRRHRWFESPLLLMAPPCQHKGETIGIYGDHARDRRRKPGVRERGIDFPDSNKIELARAALGIDWMNWRELSQAIPPIYTEYIGRQILAAIEREEAA